MELELDQEGRRIEKSGHYSGLRKIIGNRMAASIQKAPQAMISTSFEMSPIMAYKAKLAENGHKVTITDLLIRTVGIALQKNPAVNASVQNGKIYEYASINIGVAVGTDQGLYVPVIREVQDKTLDEISAELKAVAKDLKSGQMKPEYFTGSTFTISSMGMFDIEYTTPIINAPEAAILCVGTTKKKPVITDDDQFAIGYMATFSMTLDHSAMDGVPGAKFLMTIGDILKDPTKYLDENGNCIGGI